MTTTKVRIIAPKGKEVNHTNRDNWEELKPFVKFSFKTMKVIGLALIAILSALPLLKPRRNNTEVKRS